MTAFSYVPPEISTKSTAALWSTSELGAGCRHRVTSRLSCSLKPPVWKSALFSFTQTMKPPEAWSTAARTARTTSSSSRRRFSALPPYASVRWLKRGERKLDSKYPCAECISTPSNPAFLASLAAVAKRATMSSMSCWVASRGVATGEAHAGRPGMAKGMGEGPMGEVEQDMGHWRPACDSCISATQEPEP